MKNKLIALIIVFIIIPFVLPAQTWQWLNTGGSDRGGSGKTVSISANGTIFCQGSVGGNSIAHFGNVSHNSLGTSNIFVASYTPSGSLINATLTSSSTANDNTAGYGINNVEGGSYFIYAILSGGTFFDTVYKNAIQTAWAKYNQDARCLWAKVNEFDVQFGPMVMYGGKIYTYGKFSQQVVHIDTFALDTSQGSKFIARLDTNGNCLWVKQFKGTYPDMECAKNGRIYSWSYGGGCLDYDTTHVCQLGSIFSCILQTDTAGVLKAYSIHKGVAAPRSITADANYNCYVSGEVFITSILGNDTLKLYNNASQDGFIAKYDSMGALVWVKQFYSNDAVYVTASTTDDLGNTYITGSFKGKAVFGSDTVTSQVYDEMFIARYNTNGDCMGVKIIHNAASYGITQDNNGNAIVTGLISASANFDNLPYTLHSTQQNGSDFFVAKLGAITGIATATDDERLVIYPNPNKKLFTIEVPHSIIQANNALLDIYDNAGRAVQHGSVDISNSKVTVDIGTVQKGIYNVILSTSKKNFTGKVVVQ